MRLASGSPQGALLVVAAVTFRAAFASPTDPATQLCGSSAAGTLLLAARQLCLLSSRAEFENRGVLGAAELQQGAEGARIERLPLAADLDKLDERLAKSAGGRDASASSSLLLAEDVQGSRGGLVIDASADVEPLTASFVDQGRRPTITNSGRRRTKDKKYKGSPNRTAAPGVINVRLSSELQTAQQASVKAATRNSLLVSALASVLAVAGLVAGSQASMTHAHVMPLMLMALFGAIVCGAVILHNRRNRNAGFYQRPLRPPSHAGGKFDGATPAPTIQSLGGSSVPSFGSRPNTSGSPAASPQAASRDASPGSDSIMGSTRHVVRFSSAEVLAAREHPAGRGPSSAGASPVAGRDPSSAGASPMSASGAPLEPLLPLCPALVLPAHEAHLQIQRPAIDALSQASRGVGDFYILGPLGNRLLRAEVRSADAGRVLEMFMASASETLERHARVAVVTASGKPDASGFLISGPDARPYGELVPCKGGFAVHCPGRPRPALVLVGSAAGWQLAASSGEDGRHLAHSSLGRAPGGAERLEMRVRAGVDTALVVVSILAAVLFS